MLKRGFSGKFLHTQLFTWMCVVALFTQTEGLRAETNGYNQQSCGGSFMELSYLYWHTNLEGLTFAFISDSTINNVADPKVVTTSGTFLDPECSWNSGIRGSLGYHCNPCNSSCCYWSFLATGTYLPAKLTRSVSQMPIFTESVNNIISPFINPAFSGTIADTVSADLDLDFGTLDLLAQLTFCPCKLMTIAPKAGVQIAWINQKFKVQNDGLQFITTTSVLRWPHTETSFEDSYRAFGFLGGLDFAVPLICRFSLIGKMEGSLVYGQSKFDEYIDGVHQETGDVEPSLAISHLSFNNKYCKLTRHCEYELGLNWRTCFSCLNLDLSASYCFSIWFNQNDFKNITFSSTPITQNDLLLNFAELTPFKGNLSFHGLIVRVGASF